MRAFSVGRGAVAALLTFSLAVAPVFAQQITPEAKEHFRAGVDLLKDPDGARYQDAYIQFKLAYDKSKSWKVLGNLALCAMKLERDGEAILYYETYVREGAKDIDKSEVEQVERDLRVLKNGIAKVTLKADVTTAIQVSDKRTNATSTNVYAMENGVITLSLRAGTHTVTAKSGGKSHEWNVDLTPGQVAEHLFKFKEAVVVAPPPTSAAPTASAPPPPPTATEAPPPPPPNTMRTVGYVGAGVGGAMILGGFITGLMAKGKESSVKDSCDSSSGKTLCPQSKKADLDSAKSLATITNVLLIGGVVVAGAGATLIFMNPNKETTTGAFPRPSLALSPTPLWGGGGVVAHGSF
jgi:hypothetical protein